MTPGQAIAAPVRPASRLLSDFVATLSTQDVPSPVRRQAALLIRDAIGVALGNARSESVSAVRDTIGTDTSVGQARVWGTSTRGSPAVVAMANGIAIHADDFDDTHGEGGLHASASVLPAALSVADMQAVSGEELLTAVVAGYEVACRLGAAASHQFTRHHWHATAVCGSVASAAASAKVLGLDPVTTAHALGVAASMASGTLQPLEEGRPVKAFHAGWAAHNGVWASLLARSGLTAPDYSLDGRQGFFNAFVGGDWDEPRLSRGLGTEWETAVIIPKPYPCCHFLHALVDAALEFRATHAAHEVVSVLARVPVESKFVVCEPWARKLQPGNGYAAKFSLPYVVSAALLDGALTPEQFGAEAVSRVVGNRMMQAASYELDPDPKLAQSYGAELVITTESGEWSRRVQHPSGSEARPLTECELRAKFTASAVPVMGETGASTLSAQLLALEELDSVQALALTPLASE